MKRLMIVLAVVFALTVLASSLAGAHPFCGSGMEFGQFHAGLAQSGDLGGDGHIPGGHFGFATCIHGHDFPPPE